MNSLVKSTALAALFTTLATANSDIVSLYTQGSSWIQEASASLTLPSIPDSNNGDIAIWSAIMMENQASFLQGVTSNSQSGSYCGAGASDRWCNFAYTLVGSSVENGNAVTASPGSTVRTHYKLNPSTNLWDQDVYIDGKLQSSVSTSEGEHGDIFYISIECASGDCATVPSHQWDDVSVVLNEADESFGRSGGWEFSATGGEMSSEDGGKTWNFTSISVPAQNAQ